MKTKLFITGLALVAMTTLVSAQNQETGRRGQNAPDKGAAFVDSDKNGICDNFENRPSNNQRAGNKGNCKGCSNGPRPGMGRMGMHQGKGNRGNFIDADKNGICDNRETVTNK